VAFSHNKNKHFLSKMTERRAESGIGVGRTVIQKREFDPCFERDLSLPSPYRISVFHSKSH
jgi:hypothetical protein